ncbi:hypothetical protein HDU97_008344, partial [Phlyctochytrium planicorne]
IVANQAHFTPLKWEVLITKVEKEKDQDNMDEDKSDDAENGQHDDTKGGEPDWTEGDEPDDTEDGIPEETDGDKTDDAEDGEPDKTEGDKPGRKRKKTKTTTKPPDKFDKLMSSNTTRIARNTIRDLFVRKKGLFDILKKN